MRPLNRLSIESRSHRRGMAPLEMVMVLPVLVAVFALLLWVGMFSISQARVTINARNDAWHKRHVEAQSKEYDFSASSGRVEGESSETIRLSSLFDNFPQPRSTHVVFGDAWHARPEGGSSRSRQRHNDLNSHWNAKLQLKLAGYAGKNVIGNVASDIRDLMNIGSQLKSIIQQKKQELFGDILSSLSQGLIQFNNEKDSAIDESRKKSEKAKSEIRDKMTVLRQEITALDDKIVANEKEIKTIDDRLLRAKNPMSDNDKLDANEKTALESKKKNLEEEVRRDKLAKRSKEREYQLQSQVLGQFRDY